MGVTSNAGRPSIDTETSVPAGEVTRQRLCPFKTWMAARARSVASRIWSLLRFHAPIPSSTEAILALLAQDSRTADTWAKRLAHSRLVMMMISSELTIAWCRLRGGAIGNVRSARPRLTCCWLLAMTGKAPRSTATRATASACGRCGAVGLGRVRVVTDDGDDVLLFDRHANVDDELGIAAQFFGCLVHGPSIL